MIAGRDGSGLREASQASQPDYLSYVSVLGSAEVKRLARLWIGPEANRVNKEACLEAIRVGLEDRDRVRGLIARLPEDERALLGVLKARGGSAPPPTLASEVAALGLDIAPSRQDVWRGSNGSFDPLNRLLRKGIILAGTPGSSLYRQTQRLDSTYGMPALAFSDARLLDAVDAVPSRPLMVATLETAGTSWVRRPGEVLADLLGVVEAIRRLGGLPITREGRATAAALSRLAKRLGWKEPGEARAHTPGLRDRTPFYVGLLHASGALAYDPATRRLTAPPEGALWMEHPYGEQVKAWVNAYRNLRDRFETSGGRIYQGDFWGGEKLGTARGILIQGLASLARSAEDWFGFEAFSEALFERLGEFFSIGVLPQFYAYDCRTPEQLRKKRAEWREGLHQQWRRLDQPWIADALRGPLYELGLVEVALALGQRRGLPACFRLTALGRMASTKVCPDDEIGASTLKIGHPPGPFLVVQPNFEIVVYLDRVTPRLLASLEGAAERRSVGGAAATYRLTRESVYAALEAGVGIDDLLGKLADAAEHGLPANVEATLREWAARRERLVVRRGVRLLEFPDAAARDAAAAREYGAPVGERWLLVDPSAPHRAVRALARRAEDYAKPPVPCLTLTEDGIVTLDASRADLFVRTEVARWADPEEEGHDPGWRITRGSVERAIRAGRRADDILATLFARATHAPPPLLVAAIRAWGGTRHAATITSATILRVPHPEAFQAIATSPLLRKHFLGSLGSQTLVVKPGTADGLGQILMDLGLLGQTDLPLLPLPPLSRPRLSPDQEMAIRQNRLVPVIDEEPEGDPLGLH